MNSYLNRSGVQFSLGFLACFLVCMVGVVLVYKSLPVELAAQSAVGLATLVFPTSVLGYKSFHYVQDYWLQ